MLIEEGYVYHIKSEYFEFVNDDKLMKNHEGNSTRQNYFCVKIENSDILWFIPMSSIDTVNGKALQVASKTRKEIIEKVNLIFKLKFRGINLIFPDTDRIEKLLTNI